MSGKQSHQKQVESILTIASRGMQEDATKAQKQETPQDSATGHLHFLVNALANEFLTTSQQKQVKGIVEMHMHCLYPLSYSSEEEDAK